MTAPFFSARHITPRAEELCGALMLEIVRREGHVRGLPPSPRPEPDAELLRAAREMRAAGLRNFEIAAQLGVSRSRVSQVLGQVE